VTPKKMKAPRLFIMSDTSHTATRRQARRTESPPALILTVTDSECSDRTGECVMVELCGQGHVCEMK
jgi:hypothetical protein